MESKVNIANITPKKLKLADYKLGQTLGTGIKNIIVRVFRKSKNFRMQIHRKILCY